MCGGTYNDWKTPRWLVKVNDEPLVERTIRLLRENNVKNIAISSNHNYFDYLDVPILRHDNDYVCGRATSKDAWISAFYPSDEPTCYIFGDVLFSRNAIKTIVETDTDDIEFFASAPPFDKRYPKEHAEPFAFKAQNIKHFLQCVKETDLLYRSGKIKRCIAWELWQVIKHTKLNKIDYTNYVAINDFTCDIDYPKDAELKKWLNT